MGNEIFDINLTDLKYQLQRESHEHELFGRTRRLGDFCFVPTLRLYSPTAVSEKTNKHRTVWSKQFRVYGKTRL